MYREKGFKEFSSYILMEIQTEEQRRTYMREYKRKQYHMDVDKARSYSKSLKMKKRLNLSDELWNKYKHHLADVMNLKEILERVPKDIILDLVEPESAVDGIIP
jgi:hypothetical protein